MRLPGPARRKRQDPVAAQDKGKTSGRGPTLPVIGKLLGHNDIETTARYAHLAQDSVHEAAERYRSKHSGRYFIATPVAPAHRTFSTAELDGSGTVRAYKRLSAAERAFRSLRTVDLHMRPVLHRTADRVRAHVLTCTLAYYGEWHLRRKLRPMLFDNEKPEATEARRSGCSENKARTRQTAKGDPEHSFRTLLQDLATVCRNTDAPCVPGTKPFVTISPGPPRSGRKPSSCSACG